MLPRKYHVQKHGIFSVAYRENSVFRILNTVLCFRILNTVVCFDIVVLLFDLFAAAAKGQQEITITAGQSQYCFEGLSPNSLYNATVFVQTPNLEGPGVSTRERTREFRL